jgi:hypothetical protein
LAARLFGHGSIWLRAEGLHRTRNKYSEFGRGATYPDYLD